MDSIPINHHLYQQGVNDKSMTSTSNLYSVWNNFFLSAGIPSTVANDYAVTFSQHRIQIDMLKEITKEILLDMGIKAMGDIIAILRHAKQLCTQHELKGGASTKGNLVNNMMDHLTSSIQPQATPSSNNLSQRTPISSASLSTGRILSSVGGKIQSRLSLTSGALRASLGTQNPITSAAGATTTTINNNNTTIAAARGPLSSNSLTSKSARLQQRELGMTSHRPLPEKTLTVRYSSVAAMEKAQKRMAETVQPQHHHNHHHHRNHQGSVKSRLDLGSASSNNNHRSKELQGTLRNGHYTGTRQTTTHHTNHSHYKQNSRREETTTTTTARHTNSNGRLKSTVFNRLGEGPR